MKPVLCCKVVEVIDGFYKEAEVSGVDVCLKLKNIMSLTHYVTLNDVTKLRTCYLSVKKNDSVFLANMTTVLMKLKMMKNRERQLKDLMHKIIKTNCSFKIIALDEHHGIVIVFLLRI